MYVRESNIVTLGEGKCGSEVIQALRRPGRQCIDFIGHQVKPVSATELCNSLEGRSGVAAPERVAWVADDDSAYFNATSFCALESCLVGGNELVRITRREPILYVICLHMHQLYVIQTRQVRLKHAPVGYLNHDGFIYIAEVEGQSAK
jgi:hypothetical protein